MTPQDVAHRDLVNVVSQVAQGTLDAAVTPGRIVMGHLQDERFDLIPRHGVDPDGCAFGCRQTSEQ